MKLSNTRQHLTAGVIFGFLAMLLLINLAQPDRLSIGILLAILWGGNTCGWEYYQFLKYGSKPNYWEMRGWDTIADLLAGNVPVWLLVVVGVWGKGVVGVMR